MIDKDRWGDMVLKEQKKEYKQDVKTIDRIEMQMMQKTRPNDVANMGWPMNPDTREIQGEERSIGLKYLGKGFLWLRYIFRF